MLKSLQLVGFKSFAEKTRLEFPSGVTAIVGPNGSGKSNVVDAVKWVLGSQSPRSLRGKEMTDVIFGGSESRGPSPMAEVTLAFDNPPPPPGGVRLFDLDEPEVRFTRRVYRSGEGEYLVNGHACRLRDFRELLAGTGAGADSYSIIEQGRVDAALRASPLERRLLLEEAAGVSRFRLKKKEAARRLERVDQNLLRLSDIVDEVEGRLRRVRSQAGKARRYRDASLRLKEARTELGAAEWADLAAERSRLDRQHAEVEQRLADARSALADQEQRIENVERPAVADDSVERAFRESQQRLTRLDKQLAIARLSQERAAERLIASRRELVSARREAFEAAERGGEPQALAAAVATAAEYEASIAEAAERVDAAQRRRAEKAALHADASARRGRLVSISQRIAAQRSTVGERLTALRQSGGELAEQHAASARDAALAGERLAETVAARNAAADELLRLDRATADAQRALSADRATLAGAQQRVAKLRERLVGLRIQLENLAAEQRRLEQLNDDVRRLLEQGTQRDQPTPRVCGLVADLIHVEDDFVRMVEALLGDRVEQVVVDSRSDLLGTLLGVAPADGGLTVRAAFRGLDVATPSTAIDRVDLSDEEGVLGRAADFVEAEPQFAPMLRQLFSKTWFVDTLATARRLSEAVGPGLAFVTLAGDVLDAEGAVTSGPPESAARSLSRRDEAARTEAEVAETEALVGAAESEAAAQAERVEAGERAIADRQAEAVEQRARLADFAQQAATLQERARQSKSLAERLRDQIAANAAQSDRLGVRIATLSNRATRSEAALTAEADQPAGAEQALRQSESDLAAERGRLEELRTAAARHEELLASLRAERRAAGAPSADYEEATLSAGMEVEEAEADATGAALEVLRASAQIAREALKRERAGRALLQSRLARRAAERIRAEVSRAMAATRREVDELSRRAAEIELQRQRVRLEASTLEQRLRDEYGVDLANLEVQPGQPVGPEDRARLRDEVQRLKLEVQGVGAVNLESLEELDELEGRFEKLSGQYRDLTEAKKSLARLTGRINSDSRELFVATFETVREHFRDLFARLFGGGEADLVLTDAEGNEADDPLEGGVEVVACPPGKELRSLSLMSGGEKTLTCVALLLALFRSRPSPFCLLDEVDAALDEANVGRFLELLRDFHGGTQFLVITHSKRTMAGADTLYGVTMQESGVSKQISVRFDEVTEDGHLRLGRASRDGSGEDFRRRAA